MIKSRVRGVQANPLGLGSRHVRWSDGGQSHTGVKKAIFIQKQEKRTEKKTDRMSSCKREAER